MTGPTADLHLGWDLGTAYDLFVSLHVLHAPEAFGLRGAWAAGVRSRLPAPERQFLEEAQALVAFPLPWLYTLPEPKDAAAVLWALSSLPPVERLPALALSPETEPPLVDMLRGVSARQSWADADLDLLRTHLGRYKPGAKPKYFTEILEWWAHAAEFGERYLAALQSYQTVFFAEEERRIRPVLQAALQQAQALAARLDFDPLFETLSKGVRFARAESVSTVILAPSYWSTPLIIYRKLGQERQLVLFGARPDEQSLVPGDVIPDAMLQALKALADPTRLQILRYLSVEALTPSDLARRLRLRAPTVIHHLNALRLAGLVHLTLVEEGERRYAIRAETVAATFAALDRFLK
jgi:DNA-binding transcriptional ArsR family regulator